MSGYSFWSNNSDVVQTPKLLIELITAAKELCIEFCKSVNLTNTRLSDVRKVFITGIFIRTMVRLRLAVLVQTKSEYSIFFCSIIVTLYRVANLQTS